MKTLVSFFVIVSMLFSFVMPASASGNITVQQTIRGLKITISSGTINGTYNGEDGSSITWTLKTSGELTVSGSGCLPRIWYDQNENFIGTKIKTVTINSGITSLDNGAFYQCSNITKVTLPSTVTAIGYAAFGDCSSLPSISIPSEVTYIGEYAFYSCTSLQSIALPSTVTMIDTEAFANCTSLTSATVYGDIGTNAFNNCTALTSLSLGGYPEYIGDGAFAYCESLTSVDIPSSVLEVGVGAFAYCEKMTSAIASGNLGESAFDCCYALKDVELGEYCTTIGRRCFSDCKALENIIIPENVTEICDAAFQNCSSLKTINIPESVESLGDHAFYGCSSLSTLSIPVSISEVEDCLASNCVSLTRVNLHNGITSIGDGAFGNCSSLTTINIPSRCKNIGEQAFYNCSRLGNIILPSGITGIKAGAFYQCSSIEHITIPTTVKTIGNHAFACCANLTNVELNNGLDTIGDYAFALCKILGNISLPTSLTALGEGTFANCTALDSIDLSENINDIPTALFYGCSSMKQIGLPSGIQSIGDWAFMNCASLNSVLLPEHVSSLGKGAFSGCEKIKQVILPASISKLPDALFMGCGGLESVTAKSNVIKVGSYTFSDCESLTSLFGFSNVKEVGEYAFAKDAKLKYSLPSTLERIGEGAFAFCEGLNSISIGANLNTIGDIVFAGCTGLQSITVSNANTSYTTDGHILYTKDMTKMITCIANGETYSVVIPDTVDSISEYAFYNCKSLQSIVLPSTLSRIEDHMFFGCAGLRSISIPQTVNYIGEYAFAKCTNLQEIDIPIGVTQIGEGVFMGCSSLEDANYEGTITAIPSYMFAGCTSLQHFDIPNSVSFIGEYAFAECTLNNEFIIPESVCEVADFAFTETKGVSTVIFPEEMTSLGRCAFYKSKDLVSAKFLGDVYAIGAGAFENTPLENVFFEGNALGVIGEDAFLNTGESLLLNYNEAGEGWTTPTWIGPDNNTYNTNTVITGTCGKKANWELVTHTGILTISGSGEMYDSKTVEETPWHEYKDIIKSVVVKEGITSIGANTFSGINTLIEVSIPSTVTKVGYAAFAYSQNIKAVTTNGGLRSVGKCMFYACDQIETIEFSEGLTEVGAYAFYDCAKLGSIEIPTSVKTIGEGAFSTCLSLDSIRLKGKITTIGQGAFFNCAALSSIYVMNGVPKTVNNYAFASCKAGLKVYGTTNTSWLKGYDGTTETSASTVFSGACGSLQWSVNPATRTLSISGNGVIPNYSNDDAPWYRYHSIILSINIESGVTAIGDYAFESLSNVNIVTIPDTVTTIGRYAFAACSSLRNIDLPNSVSKIDVGAFSACVSLQEISLPYQISKIADYTFSECLQLKSVNARASITDIGYSAFYCCKQLESIPFISQVRAVGDFSFTMCNSLTTVDLSACSSIGDDAFFCCTNLTEVSISAELNNIGKKAFSQSGLIEIVIPNSLMTISQSAFELCDRLQSVVFEGNGHTVETDAFYGCQNLTDLDLVGVVSIGERAFMACGMTTIHIPDSLTDIGNGAFADCESLNVFTCDSSNFNTDQGILYKGTQLIQYPAGKELGGFTVPSYVTSIASNAFYGCRKLVEIGMGDQVQSIGNAAFALCSGLKYVVFGSGINSIPMAAFGECINLELVRFLGNAPTNIGEDAFYHCSKDLTFEYVDGNTGWTVGSWTGPDGIKYTTRNNKLTVEAIDCNIDAKGEIEANLNISNLGSDTVHITSIQISDNRFTVTGSFPMVLNAGDVNQSITVKSYEPITEGVVSCKATVEFDGYSMDLPVRFVPQQDYYMWAKTDGENVYAHIVNSTITDRAVCFVAAIQNGDRFVSARSSVCTLTAEKSSSLEISFGAIDQGSDYRLTMYLLDANDYAPLCEHREISHVQAKSTVSAGYVSIAYMGESLQSRSVVSESEEMKVQFTIDENVPPAKIENRYISQEEDLGCFLVSRSAVPTGSGTYEYSETTFDVYIRNIDEMSKLFQRGEKPVAENIEHVDEMRSADIRTNIGVSYETPTYERSLADVPVGESNMKFFTVQASGNASANLGSFSARDGYEKPNVSLSGSVKGSVAQVQLTNKDFKVWKTNDWKINVNSSLDVTSLEASGTLTGSGEGVEASGSLGADALRMNNAFTLSKGGHDLIKISADPGAGASISGSAVVSADKIKFKVGAKVGLGGDVSIEINPGEILKAVFESDMAKNLMESMAQRARIYNVDEEGSEELIAAAGFVFDSDGNIINLWDLPLNKPVSYPGDSLYTAALPSSLGGASMPTEEFLTTTSSGTKKTSVNTNKLNAQQKMQLASKLFGMPINVLSTAEMILKMAEQKGMIINSITYSIQGYKQTDFWIDNTSIGFWR